MGGLSDGAERSTASGWIHDRTMTRRAYLALTRPMARMSPNEVPDTWPMSAH
jgi:hypothetical protein